MWDSFVSVANAMVERVFFRFAELFWQHPVVGACFMVGFLSLAILLWIEFLKGTVSEPRRLPDDTRPIRLHR